MHRPRTSWLSISLFTATVLAVTGGLSSCGQGAKDDAAVAQGLDEGTGYSATDAEILETGADGKPRYRLRAARIEQDPRTLAISLRSIDMRVDDTEAGGWQVRADSGSIPAGARRVTLAGDVQLQSEREGSGLLRVRTATLDYDFATTRAVAPGKVSLDMQGNLLEGVGLEADLTRRQLTLKSAIHGEFSR